uniref:Maltase n=1 Tax=Scleropages formosus TaxID=113540 RepID=A0A8C9TBY6_SCLFO
MLLLLEKPATLTVVTCHPPPPPPPQMGKRKFSGLEVTLIVLFLLVTVVAVVLVVLPLRSLVGGRGRWGGHSAALTPPFCSQRKCLQRGCCWDPVDEINIPWCFFSLNHNYEVSSVQKPNDHSKSTAVLKRRPAPTLFGGDIEQLSFQAEMQTQNRLRFKITDAERSRFEVPHEHVTSPADPPGGALNYELELLHIPFGLRVFRASSKKLFDTTVGPLVFADQYLQLSAKLPSHNIYGLGEHVHQNFRHDTNWKTWPIFTRDSFPNGGTHNLYGHYPYFACLEDESGASFGVFLMNSNAMEVTLQPAPAVTYRTIGGVLDFYILLGDTPEAVVQEFLELVGRPVIPPYWSLGFQLSRWDYGNLTEVKKTVERNREIGLPYDVQYTDIDYMEDKKDFTYNAVNFTELPQFADYMHAGGQKYILILDPAISNKPRINGPYESYDRGTQKKAWVTEADGETPLLGEVWPGLAVFPDYTNPACIEWWVDEIQRFHQEVKHDALWIDMNEVSNFQKGSVNGCSINNLNDPPFTPRILDNLMYSKTLCMDAKQTWGSHYDVHSLYGYSMVLATEVALKKVFGNNRSLMLTRSSFPGVGKYSGHWLGDNAATWNDIKWAIPGMLEFSLFGVPYIGADICGFFDDVSEELCRRWMQVGAFYPFSRNHNAQNYKPQDPAWFGEDSLLVNTSKHYLNIRYTLLPYLYTLFYKAHAYGDTVVRPVMHEFYSDSATWAVDRQFLWGPYLLITPVLDPGVETVAAYIPDSPWYDYETVRMTTRRQYINMYLPADKLGLHIRGGAILPTQRPAVTTVYSRKNPMGLIIALDDNEQAAGELFWDDGESRGRLASVSVRVRGLLTMNALHSTYVDPNDLRFENITVLGANSMPTTIVDCLSDTRSPTPQTPTAHMTTLTSVPLQVLYIRNLTLLLGQNYTVKWNGSVSETERFDCHPEEGSDADKCLARGCIWNVSENVLPGETLAVSPTPDTTGWSFEIQRNARYRSQRLESPDINTLRVEIKYLSADMLQFKIYDPANKRYEVPVPLNIPPTPEADPNKRLYDVEVNEQPFGIKVIRKSTGTVIWDSTLPGFTFSDLFIQISTRLPSNYIYGFGETEHSSYHHDLNWHTWGMFSKDQPPGYKMNCYGVQPFYMGLENTMDAHGVLLLNSNAMDVTLQPTPALTYRTVGGILDFFIVMGPTPEQVVQEYTELVGRPVLPAYWSLGFQLCRYGYQNTMEIENLYNEMRNAGIPYDIQYADIDYMERQLDFTIDKDFQDLPELVNTMRSEGMRFIFILDPAISGNETDYPAFTRGHEKDVFIKWPLELEDDIVWGKVWPDFPNVTVDESLDWDTQVELYRAYTAFPDFFRNQTAEWWLQEIKEFYVKMKFDGLWIDMNEPASFVHGTVGGKCLGPEKYDYPPYMPQLESKNEGLKHKTLCMNSEQFLADVPGGPRGVVVSRSTYPSSGKWVGHWLGDNTSGWDQLFKSIIGMLEFSLFGISYTGADICGFFNSAEYEMCLRWMQLGAFYPYSRNHNGKGNPRQDPVAWNSTFAEASRNVLNIRYTLLPYLYTLMFEAHATGSTVVRGGSAALLRRFRRNPAFLSRLFLSSNPLFTLSFTFPSATMAVEISKNWMVMPTPLEHINLHVRGGYILPWQTPENTTHYSRKNPLGLIVALSDAGAAQGTFFWDDGQGIGESPRAVPQPRGASLRLFGAKFARLSRWKRRPSSMTLI